MLVTFQCVIFLVTVWINVSQIEERLNHDLWRQTENFRRLRLLHPPGDESRTRHVPGHDAISGEIYRVNSQQFQMLDELEWYPRYYQRIEIATDYGRAWMYIVKAELCRGKKRLGGSWP